MRSLVQHYLDDIAGLSVKDMLARKRLWHATVARYLTLMSITSDPVAPLPEIGAERVTLPFAPFFLRRSEAELVALYRATKPGSRKPS